MVDGPPQPTDDDAKAQERRRLVRRLAVVGPLVLGLLVIYVFWLPSLMYPSLTDTDLRDVKTAQDEPDAAKIQELKGARLKLQNDARTTLLQGLGAVLVLTGATAGVWATLRQVQATRDQIRETATASRNQLKLSEQGQVTDRYTRAVEQLGHEKAPVRLGALYSLEHLAQDNPQYRQTVVDVVCAYLRMPYTPPAQTELDAEQAEEMAPPANGGNRAPHPAPGRDPAREEFQVRQTAQRLLADHLRCPPETSGQEAQLLPPSPQQTFWPGISLDLTGATLIDFNFKKVSVIQARFDAAAFQGTAWFEDATFQGDAWFAGATFHGVAWFAEATFHGVAWFEEATFRGDAWFAGATFDYVAQFHQATFQSDARFGRTIFQSGARFQKASFQGDAQFHDAIFQGLAWFTEATFQGTAEFAEATFQGGALFGKVTFHDGTAFHEATFHSDAEFDRATFEDLTRFGEAHVLHLDDLDRRRVWLDGWTVRPDPTDPSRGTLWPAEHAWEPESAVPPPDPTDSGSGTG